VRNSLLAKSQNGIKHLKNYNSLAVEFGSPSMLDEREPLKIDPVAKVYI
jgi:hypothetical protein